MMTDKRRDLLLAGVLLALALGWTLTVLRTIPGGFAPGDIGARGFPLVLGVALAVLAAALGLRSLRGGQEAPGAEPEEAEAGEEKSGFGLLPLLLVAGHILAYGFFFERLGFVATTVLIVASLLVVCVGERRVGRVAAYSLGTALGCWLVFSKIMGVHLPQGSWIVLG